MILYSIFKIEPVILKQAQLSLIIMKISSIKHKNVLLIVLGFAIAAAFLYLLYLLSNEEIIGIIGIVFTIAIGFLIYFLQGKTDKEVKKAVDRIDKTVSKIDEALDKMNQITETQYQMIKEEQERRTRMKSSPTHISCYKCLK